MNILLQILDEGKITDAQGRIVSFESTVIVMTSNCGTEQRASSLGFNKTPSDIVRDRVMQSLSEFCVRNSWEEWMRWLSLTSLPRKTL